MNPIASGGSVASWNFFSCDLKILNRTDYILLLFMTVNVQMRLVYLLANYMKYIKYYNYEAVSKV